MSFRRRDLIYLAVASLIALVAYLAFRWMYFAGEQEPFAQEVILVFLGGVATVYLTAALLNRQTELELRKEGRVIVLEQKSDIYMACIELVAKIAEVQRHDPGLIDDLHVLSHKLAVIGSIDVVVAFERVLSRIHAGLIDGRLSNLDSQQVMSELAELTAAMREDILAEVGLGDAAKALAAIRRNAARMEELEDLPNPPP